MSRLKKNSQPAALTIAGSDSGSGAGIQADLKTFAALSVHGLTAITCLTAQSPDRIRRIEPVSTAMLREQIAAALQFRPRAAKAGMLYAADLIRVVRRFIAEETFPPLVIDPVLISTSGTPLLQTAALTEFVRLIRHAALLTPNRAEAEFLLNQPIASSDDLRASAAALFAKLGCPILVKGGHLPTRKSAVDFFFDGETELVLEAPFHRGLAAHGTGCTLSAAIAAYLANGSPLTKAVTQAKQFIAGALQKAVRSGPFRVLNPFWNFHP